MKRSFLLFALLSLVVILLAACDSAVSPDEVESDAATDVSGKKHYDLVISDMTFNPAVFEDPVTFPSYTGYATSQDGIKYHDVVYSTGSSKNYDDMFFAGQTMHFSEIHKLYLDVAFGPKMEVISGEPVLTVWLAGTLAPNNRLATHGYVIQGEGVFADWVGRRVHNGTTLGTDHNSYFFLN